MQASNIVYTHAWHWTSASGWKQIPVRPRIIMIHFINQRYLQREKWCFATHFDRHLYRRRHEKPSLKTTQRRICLLKVFHVRPPNTKTRTLFERRRSPIPDTTWPSISPLPLPNSRDVPRLPIPTAQQMPQMARGHLIAVISHAGRCQRNTKRV